MTAGQTAAAYSATGGAWQRGPGRLYDRLAEVLVERCPVPVAASRALDLGAGTGAASRALIAAGAAPVIALDAAAGMLAFEASRRPPAIVGDAVALPFRNEAFTVTLAAFSLNHVDDPAAGLREAVRITQAGGGVVVSGYADDDTHPVKGVVEAALADRGWSPPPWYDTVRRAASRLGTVEAAREVAARAGIEADVAAVRVPFPDLDAAALVDWRLGMAQHAPFVAGLTPEQQADLVAQCLDGAAGGWPPLERSIIVVRAVRT